MSKFRYKIGDTIWHGFRYWKMDDLAQGEIVGWQTKYIEYFVTRITPKRIVIFRSDGSEPKDELQLNRATMEREGKQYHTRFHEYFYAKKPTPESKEWNWAGSRGYTLPSFSQVFGIDCLATLGLSLPCTQADVRRAYKRLALKAHPDLGGSNHEFVKLKQAHDSALRLAN